MVYATWAEGYRPGGVNRSPGVGETYDPDFLDSYEIGWKGTWLDRRMQVNGTVYYVDYDDFQTQGFDGNNITVRNAGSMESQGVELDFIYVPTAWATLGVAVGYAF